MSKNKWDMFDTEAKSDNTNIHAKKPTETPDLTDSQKDNSEFMSRAERKDSHVKGDRTDLEYAYRLAMNNERDSLNVSDRYEDKETGEKREIPVGKSSYWDYKQSQKNGKPLKVVENNNGKWKGLFEERNEKKD